MSIAVFRHVAFLRAVNLGKHNSVPKEDLRALFIASGAAWADTYIASGNVVFDCLPARVMDIVEAARELLRTRHQIDQPIIVKNMADREALCADGVPIGSGPEYVGVMATFLSDSIASTPRLPSVSRRGDITLFEIRNAVALSHRIRINGTAGDANAFVERLTGLPATSRSWSTIEGLVRKYGTNPHFS